NAANFDVNATLTELTDTDAGENTDILSESGAVTFSDADINDGAPSTRFTLTSFESTAASYESAIGTFNLSSIISTSSTDSYLPWDFSVEDALLDGLGENDTLTQVYTVTVEDDQGASTSQDVTITLAGTNDAPVATDDALSVDDNFEVVGDLFQDLGNGADSDVDEGATFTITALNGDTESIGIETTLDSGALITLNADGTVNYNPNEAFEGLAAGETATDSFTYTITDDFGATDTATVSVTINGTEVNTFGTDANELISGTASDDDIVGAGGSDILIGGGGNDVFRYRSYADRMDQIRDFEIGSDRIDLQQIFDDLPDRYSSATDVNRFTEYVQLIQQGANTEVRIDLAGNNGDVFRPLLTIENTAPTDLSASDFIV
ncbi:MAG: Ig-like domain-containing protein, partial [Cyanobacteria bacterium J06598_3]